MNSACRLTRLWSRPPIEAQNLGLSDRKAELEFRYYPQRPGETSLLEHPFQDKVQNLTGKVMRGDDFCRRNGIDSVELLKIDVEGMESAVLRGFSGMLSEQKISVVQFEYEKLNTETKFLLKDFYELFGSVGYRIGKLLPSYIDFRDYDYFHELEWASNFVAVSEHRMSWVKEIAG